MLKLLDLYVGPLFMLALGLVMLVLTFATPLPKASDLSEVRGHLRSYYFKQEGPGRDDYTTILVLEEGSRFWTDAVTKESASDLFAGQGQEIRFYVEPNSTSLPIDGAVKTLGLSVGGREVQSLDVALAREEFFVHFGFPGVAIFSFAVAFRIYRRAKKKPEG